LPEVQKYLCILSFTILSLLELYELQASRIFDFQILASSQNSVLIRCDTETAKLLAARSGGIYKIGNVCGSRPETLSSCLPLPESSKFNWTVSGYECTPDILDDTKNTVSLILKDASLGKSRFVHPDSSGEETEMKIADLLRNVLIAEKGKRVRGLDVIVDCSLGEVWYGYTQFTSNLEGFRERDFGRPYQHPTVTLSPRLARILVNLCGLPRGKTILDPFCGVGTILQEALLLGYNTVGVEISSSEVARCRENLDWLKKHFQVSPKLSSKIIRGDTFNLELSLLPKVDAVVTEPILLPKLERNPPSEKAEEMIRVATEKYRLALRAFSSFLRPEGKVSIVGPELMDDRGKLHGIGIDDMARELGFALDRPLDSHVENPCRVPTKKRKIIQRKVYLLRRLSKAA
jgi:tRNA G10  N-methylase Trm11